MQGEQEHQVFVISRSISFVFDSLKELSMSVVDGSLKLNHVKSGSDYASNILTADSLIDITCNI